MTKRTLLPYFFDPRQGSNAEELLALAKLHLLLFERLAIQDNFLVSELLFRSRDPHFRGSPFCDWIERGWVTVALRDNAYSLTDLKQQLLRKALEGEYTPFEELERGVQLYRSKRFATYLGNLDRCLQTEEAIIQWNPEQLGLHFRNLMKQSAENGSSGLSREGALHVWNAIEERASRGPHSRSMYHQYAETVHDPDEKRRIRKWAEFQYLMVPRDAMGFGVSLPRKYLVNRGGWDPWGELSAQLAEDVSPIDPLTIRGRDCVLFSRPFLAALKPRDIETLRKLTEFRNLTEARLQSDPQKLRVSLLAYLRALGEIGPRVANPSIVALRAQVGFKRDLAVWAGVLGVIVAFMNPELGLGQALCALAIFLKATSGTEALLHATETQTIDRLEAQRLHRRTNSVAEFCHDSESDSESRSGRPTG